MATSNAQRRSALIEANDSRRTVREFKLELGAGRNKEQVRPKILLAAWTLEEDWERVGFMRVHQFLEVIPLFGAKKTEAACRLREFGPRGLWPLRRIDSLTSRQRALLAAEIRRVAGVEESVPRQPRLPREPRESKPRVVREKLLRPVVLDRRVGTPFDQMVAGR